MAYRHARLRAECAPSRGSSTAYTGNGSTIDHPAASDRSETAALARCLGESPDVFRWSTFKALPEARKRALAMPRPRLYFACLAAGYHSALFSIELLDA